MVFTEGPKQGTNAMHLALDQWRLDLEEIYHRAQDASEAVSAIPTLPTHNAPSGAPKVKTPRHTYDAVGEHNDILTEDALERTRIYGDAELMRLGTEVSISDKLRIQLALVNQLWQVQRNAILSDTRLSDAEKKNELLRVDLEHEREGIQARINAKLDEELAKQEAIAAAARRRNAALKAGASAIVGTVLSGHPSGSAIGAGIGTAFLWVPGVGQFLPGIGSFLGGLFDKGDKPNEPPPVIKSLAAIERAQRDTITAIKSQTDALLKPENRFFNLPSGFTLPSYAPAIGSTTYGDTHVNVSLTVNGDTNGMTPQDIQNIVQDGMGQALYQMRNAQGWN